MTAIDDQSPSAQPSDRWSAPHWFGSQTVRIVPTRAVIHPAADTETGPIAIPTQVAARGPKHAREPEPVEEPDEEPITEAVVEPVAVSARPVTSASHPIAEPAAVPAPLMTSELAPRRSAPVVGALRRLEAGHWALMALVAANATLIPIAIVTKG